MATETNTVLEVKGLSGGYGRVPVLHGIELQVPENQVVGILGHNGMGKSTLLKTLMGFLPPTGGAVRFRGDDITALAPNARTTRRSNRNRASVSRVASESACASTCSGFSSVFASR